MFSAYDLFLIIGLTQGVISSCIFFISKDQQQLNKILGVIIMILSLISLKYLLQVFQFSAVDNATFLPFQNILFLCPMCYFYVKSLLVTELKIDAAKIIHFVPGSLFFVYDLVVYFILQDIENNEKKFELASAFYYFHVNSVEYYLVVVSAVFYFCLSLLKLFDYRRVMTKLKVDSSYPVYYWVRNFFIWCFFLIIFWMYNVFMEPFARYNSVDVLRWNLFYLYETAFIYYLGFLGFQQIDSNVISSKFSLESVNKKINALDVNKIRVLLTAKLEEEKIYLNPTLSISEFALEMSVSSDNLSFVINHELNVSFRDLINSYRVNEAKEKLQQIPFSKESILAISLDSGFNSQASFYRAFKKFEGITPKQFLSNCD